MQWSDTSRRFPLAGRAGCAACYSLKRWRALAMTQLWHHCLQALGDAPTGQSSASHVLYRQAEIRMKQNPPRWLQNRMTSAVKEVVRVRRELRKARRLKDAMRLERELKQAQIEYAYAQHWVMLT